MGFGSSLGSAFHKAGGVGGYDYLKSGGGGGGSSPYPNRVVGKTGYSDALLAEDYATRIGRTADAARARARADAILKNHPDYGSTTAYDSPFDNASGGTEWKTLGPGGPGSSDAARTLSRLRGESLWPGHASSDYASGINSYRVGLAKDVEGAMKQGLINEIDPSLQRAQTAADANLDTSAIDAGTEAAIRSRFVAAAKQDSATRLARISAGLGLGNTTNSPAALALAQRDAESADSQITSGLRDMSVQTQQMNRDQHTKDIELATRIAAARYGVLNGDSKSLIGMQGDIASMIDALYSRNESLKIQRDAAGQAGDGSGAAGIASGAMQGAAGGAALGPWGAAGGALFGAGMGYLGSR